MDIPYAECLGLPSFPTTWFENHHFIDEGTETLSQPHIFRAVFTGVGVLEALGIELEQDRQSPFPTVFVLGKFCRVLLL